MSFIADLHLHSKYSRATSRDMDVAGIARWAKLKGIGLVGTADFTHPVWLREMKANLREDGSGLLTDGGQAFMLTTEVSLIYPKNGRLRKIHVLLCAPSFATVERINAVLGRFGSLMADGRPTLTLPADRLTAYVLELDPTCMVIPAHMWTPHFSLFGSNSGFDALGECFEDQTGQIFAGETGLSSDPPMNWRLSQLDRVTLVSNGDAHSPAKLGREATVFECALTYGAIREALRTRAGLAGTIEFFPEEGKYHYDGHRDHHVRLHPRETRANGGRCPTCGRPVTIGVLHRVEDLADRPEGYRPPGARGYRNLVPLEEIVAEAFGAGVGTARVREEYMKLAEHFTEFAVLQDLPLDELARHTAPRVVEAIGRTREGQVQILPGYDGVFGEIHLFPSEKTAEPQPASPAQTSLF